MPIKQYIRKPVIVEAIQWTGDNYEDIELFFGDKKRDRIELKGVYKLSTTTFLYSDMIGQQLYLKDSFDDFNGTPVTETNWIVKEENKFKIYSNQEFMDKFEEYKLCQ